VFDKVRKTINFGDLQTLIFEHLGLEIEQNEETKEVKITQTKKIENIQEIMINQERRRYPLLKLNEKEKNEMRMVGGSLLYIACMTRPDIAVDVGMLSGATNSTVQDMLKMNKLIKYTKNTRTIPLEYKRLRGNMSSPQIICYADAAMNNLKRGGSQGGMMIFITNDVEINKEDPQWIKGALIAWRSARIKRVVTCTLSAELLQQSTTYDSGVWLKNLCEEIFQVKTSLNLRTDCLSLVSNLNSMRTQIKEKRLLNEVYVLKEAWEMSEIQDYQFIPTKYMIADGLTKTDVSLKELITKSMRCAIRVPSIEDRGDKELKFRVTRPRWQYD
jgi:hypothetical protein